MYQQVIIQLLHLFLHDLHLWSKGDFLILERPCSSSSVLSKAAKCKRISSSNLKVFFLVSKETEHPPSTVL